MRYVYTKDLQPGMVTTKAVYNNKGVLVLSANHTLTPEIIGAMTRSGMTGTYIYDEYSDYEELNKIVDDDTRAQLVSNLKDINIDQVIFLTNKIIDDIMKAEDLLIDLNMMSLYDQNTYEHSVNVATLVTMCGVGMGLDNDSLRDLAIAGALHDIGKRAIPREILEKQGALTLEEREIMETHPQKGYDMLYDNMNISSYVRGAILTHHENFNGTGYPNGYGGDQIPLFGRIIHVADVYDALCRNRIYKPGYRQTESIEYLMAHCGEMFDINVVNTFLKYLVLFPVGCNVLLSDGRIAHVIKNRSSAVQRPVVMLKDGTILDLAKDFNYLNVTVIKEINGELTEEEVSIEEEVARKGIA